MLARRNRRLAGSLVVVVAAMVGLSFAAVPLYRLFCQATGYGGTTQRTEAAASHSVDRWITVRFNAETAPDLPWTFKPEQASMRVKVGESQLAYYRAENRSREALIGSATYNVTPLKAGYYFDKTQCFCFSEQTLGPGESAELPVAFYIDPDIVKDRNLDEVETITLSYTFFLAKRQEQKTSAVSSAPANPANELN
ncbi:MAG: cytochrome c oxidase assembly protein [Proteobacteria bacterium]|nr:cytochrome c oxidase assembly protein [Pseudomonadota bacterium]MBI3496550.1 cytochrome c oxidase assembly protein [Pseudomonadota bacterium]